jgi:DNA-binding PadR family transcriptional regulator
VLGLLDEAPGHGFALARELSPSGALGRIITVRRPLVYRALDRLVADGMATPDRTEPGAGGPARTVHGITEHGRSVLAAWLDEPVPHIRDLRIAFLLKIALLRRNRKPAADLIARQRQALRAPLAALSSAREGDVVDLWRRQNALAVASFLDELERHHR